MSKTRTLGRQGARKKNASSPSTFSSSSPLPLQQAAGNHQVARWIKGGINLNVSQPGDAYEREADRVAKRVISSPAVAEPAPEATAKGPVSTSPDLLQRLGPGRPLSPGTRATLEPHLGQDLEGVRVHTGPQAEEAARAVQARAFTVGRDVVFGAGRYEPGTREGLGLLAHEVTHVAQQAATGTPALQRSPDPPAQFESPEVKKASSKDLVKAFLELDAVRKEIDRFIQQMRDRDTPMNKKAAKGAGVAAVGIGPAVAVAVNLGARAEAFGLLHGVEVPVPGLPAFKLQILCEEPSPFEPREGFPKPKMNTPSGYGFILNFKLPFGGR